MTERLYYTNAFLTEFDATVTEIQELSRVQGQSLWRVALDRSAFYPTSGGQPYDTGHLVATARSGAELTVEVVGVEEDDNDEVWHHLHKPLQPGTAVRGRVHVPRRLDHIQQHSGQHLLSAAFLKICSAPTVSFHLGDSVSTIDLATDGISSATLHEVEDFANRTIAEDWPVTTDTISRSQAEAWLATGELRKLPPRAGDIRIVEIAGESAPLDRNACGGTHVRSTGQIGGLHLRGMEKVKQGWRVEFVCGLRAMLAARNDFRILSEAGQQLSVGFAELPEAVRKIQIEIKAASKRMEASLVELTRYRAAELIRQTPLENGLRLVRLNVNAADRTNPSQVKLLASHLTGQTERTVAVLGWLPDGSEEPATILFARSRDLDIDCGLVLRQTLSSFSGRGGGSKDLAQGSVPRQHLATVMEALAAPTVQSAS